MIYRRKQVDSTNGLSIRHYQNGMLIDVIHREARREYVPWPEPRKLDKRQRRANKRWLKRYVKTHPVAFSQESFIGTDILPEYIGQISEKSYPIF